ncbi:MAG: methyltransferase domain-containing protein [Bdellovibrionales bacterium]|nr:methyltransferase domain-containing protein [Bdellovibrionales bacterium]
MAFCYNLFRDKNPKFSYQIIGTDISREMVEICKVGVYKGRAIESFKSSKPDLFAKYMKAANGDGFQVLPEIKSRLKFHEHNLFRPLSHKDDFDLVLVRNVLIYFTGEDQEKVLKLIEPKLKEDGALIIGESESLTHINTGYQPVQPLIYRKNPTSSEKKVA